MPDRLLLDTSSLMYRAYFALPATIRDDAGRPVNAVHGYLDMTTRLLSGELPAAPGLLSPAAVFHVFDDAIVPVERARAYPAYKAQRRPDPEGLPEQFDLLEEVLTAAGLPRARAIGWEADDAIGALCARFAEESGAAVDIVTGDRDLLQLVRDARGGAKPRSAVRVLFTLRGVSELACFDEAMVLDRYGVPPQRYTDFATLRGDPSDGLPGVRGIGPKTAAQLVQAYPTLDALLEAGERAELPPRPAGSLRAARDYIVAMRDVVPVRATVPVDLEPAARPDVTRLAAPVSYTHLR
ncbi:MAG: 5'-3' exonuclease, partial [Candidatus Eisenbacteria bacterium]|nr:5'-3' exonuclease [Candidatus Eisenbacteria bacterium]